MNNEKKEELLMNITQKEFRAVFDKTYDAAYHKYHNGRHDERRRLTLDGWLVLNQNKIREFFVAGADAIACVKSTCYNMRKAGYTVHVLSDCITC